MTGMRALFTADWVLPVFMHFRVDRDWLQERVPFEVDRFDGQAYVSLVAFTQQRLRPIYGGSISRWLSTPLAEHEFLNLRTYVRHGRTRAIFFIAEWIPNRLATLIGPRTYGLPYRLGNLRYRGDLQKGLVGGKVRARGMEFCFSGTLDSGCDFRPCDAGSLDHFLLERYSAFTTQNGVHRRFDIDHRPWPMTRLNVRLKRSTLLAAQVPCLEGSQPDLAHISPGVMDVAIGWPSRQTLPRRLCTL